MADVPQFGSPRILYDRDGAAEMLSIGTTALDDERRAGRIVAKRFRRGGIRYAHEDLVRWAEMLPDYE